jgi:cytochrome c2
MTFRTFALLLAAHIALSAEALGQTAGRSAGPDDGGPVFNNACRTCHTLPGHSMKPYGGLASAEERAKIIAFLEANGGN